MDLNIIVIRRFNLIKIFFLLTAIYTIEHFMKILKDNVAFHTNFVCLQQIKKFKIIHFKVLLKI